MRRLAYSIFFFTAPLLAESIAKPASVSQGPNIAFAEITSRYEAGDYKKFLEDLHAKYVSDLQQGKLKEFLQVVKAEYVDTSKNTKELAKQIEALDQERNARLREIANKNPDAPISVVITQLFTSDSCVGEEREVWDYLNNLEKGAFAKSTDPFEKKLQEVQEEFALKKMMLHSSYFAGEKSKDATINEHVVLEEEKLQKIVVLCQGSSNPMAKKIVATAPSVFPKFVKTKMSAMYTLSLVQGEINPQDEVESKVKEILVDYSKKKRQLMSSQAAQ